MRIVGIDCGTERTGFGVIESDGRRHQLVTAGIVKTKTTDPFAQRLHVIATQLREVILQFTPDIMAVEEVFHSINTKSALKLAHVRGVAFLMAAEAGLSVEEYSPLSVKMSVVGYGRAEKQQVQMMVLSLLGINQTFESFDATDALAVAICHSTRASTGASVVLPQLLAAAQSTNPHTEPEAGRGATHLAKTGIRTISSKGARH